MSSPRSPASGTTRTGCGTGGAWTGVERAAPDRRHPPARVDLRIAGMPPVSVGYIAPPGDPVVETTSVTAEADFAADGLPIATTLTMHPGPITATVDIRGYAPVRLVSPEGRVSLFPRAWAAVRTSTAATGWDGWVEPQPARRGLVAVLGSDGLPAPTTQPLTTWVPPASSSCLPCLVGLPLMVTAITM